MHCFPAMNTVRFSGLWLAESFLDNRPPLSLRSSVNLATMNTLRTALVPGLIAGVISIFTSWLWMGVIFHRFQKETPSTWRPEGPRNYVGASLLHLLAAIGIACLFTLIVRFNVAIFAAGLHGRLLFAIAIWGAMSLPIILESALFIRLHPFVVLGQLLDWLTTSLLACVVTGCWLRS